MDQMNTERMIAEFLAKSAGLAALEPDDDLLALGIIDSLTMMDLLVFVESQFGVQLDFQDLTPSTFENVARISAVIENYRTRKGESCRAA